MEKSMLSALLIVVGLVVPSRADNAGFSAHILQQYVEFHPDSAPPPHYTKVYIFTGSFCQ